MRDKKHPPRLILYQKYRHDHHLDSPAAQTESKNPPEMPAVRIMNVAVTLILAAMIFLSAVGLVTLMDPQMRQMLLETVETRAAGMDEA